MFKLIKGIFHLIVNQMVFVFTKPALSLWIIRYKFSIVKSVNTEKQRIGLFKRLKYLLINNMDVYNNQEMYCLWMLENEKKSNLIGNDFQITTGNKGEIHLISVEGCKYNLIVDPFVVIDQIAMEELKDFCAKQTFNVAYSDYDFITNGKRSNPCFLPHWNKHFFLSANYTGPLLIVSNDFFETLQLKENQLDLVVDIKTIVLLQCIKQEVMVDHITKIIAHKLSVKNVFSADKRSVIFPSMLSEIYPNLKVKVQHNNVLQCIFSHPNKLPLVSIIISTKNNEVLLKKCIDSLIERTNYPHYEIVVVDNNSTSNNTLEYFVTLSKHSNIEISHYSHTFNFAKINNIQAQKVKGDVLCFLNDDTEILAGNWLSDMVNYALLTEVGAVGAKLLYADKTIQHLGVCLGIKGVQGHKFRNINNDRDDILELYATHETASVTAACMVIEKAKFKGVGGFDENFAIAFNDLDLCLKLRQKGYSNIVVPSAELYHYEGKSRGSDFEFKNQRRYLDELKRITNLWGKTLLVDPYLNPNISNRSELMKIKI